MQMRVSNMKKAVIVKFPDQRIINFFLADLEEPRRSPRTVDGREREGTERPHR